MRLNWISDADRTCAQPMILGGLTRLTSNHLVAPAPGRRTEDVAGITGYSRSWIYELVWGYNRIGPETLGDGRQDNPGAAPLLDDLQQANLTAGIKRICTPLGDCRMGVK